MSEDEQFIEKLRKMQVVPMPDDLRALLAEEPQPEKKGRGNVVYLAIGLAAAACVALMLINRQADEPEEGRGAVNVLRVDSTLLSSRSVEFEEVDGVYHEVVEEEWLDEISARSSASPLEADSVVVRTQRRSVPVEFL